MTNKSDIIQRLAIELAKRDRDELCRLVSTMSFNGAYYLLKGYNLNIDEDAVVGKFNYNKSFFDVNYKNITTTIYRRPNGNCEVYNCVDVWLDCISTPILERYSVAE